MSGSLYAYYMFIKPMAKQVEHITVGNKQPINFVLIKLFTPIKSK